MKTDDQFRDILTGFNFLDIDAYPDTIFGLDRDFRLAYFNPAWFRFAEENDGEPQISRDWGPGRSIFDAIPDELKPYYRNLYAHALATGKSVEHVYECSSPLISRKFHQIVYPAGGRALLAVNSLVVSMQIQTSAGKISFQLEKYRDPEGILHQCAHCRKVLNMQGKRWEWVSFFIKHIPAGTSHSLCPQCRNYFFTLGGTPARQ